MLASAILFERVFSIGQELLANSTSCWAFLIAFDDQSGWKYAVELFRDKQFIFVSENTFEVVEPAFGVVYVLRWVLHVVVQWVCNQLQIKV